MTSLPLISVSGVENHLLAGLPIIDVRAPVEFADGSLPGSVNLPIMNNEERALVGTCYKQKGQEAAIKLGHSLVGGEVKASRVRAWSEYLRENPQSLLACFRGGLRSKIAQQWLAEAGLEVVRIEGGYKKIRQHLVESTIKFSSDRHPLLVISGATGSGKTLLLRSLASHRPVCDLEKWAHHRGSAFGGYPSGQPPQINFENQLALDLIRAQNSNIERPLLIEDESRLIGRNVQPPTLFEHLRASPVVLIEESLESRVQVTFEDYILQSPIARGSVSDGIETFAAYKKSLEKITKKLGGLRAQEVMSDIKSAEQAFVEKKDLEPSKVWIQKLLAWYYDPMYLGSLESRSPQILFRGTREQCREFLLKS